MPHSERIEQLWKEDDGELEKRGPLFSERTALSETLTEARSFGNALRNVDYSDETIISPVVSFSLYGSGGKKRLQYEAKSRQTGTNSLFLAIQQIPDGKKDINDVDTTLYEYTLNPNGVAVLRDDLMPASGLTTLSENDITTIRAATTAVRSQIQSDIQDIRRSRERERTRIIEAKQERRAKIAKAAIGTAVALGLTGGLAAGGYFGWNAWIHEPGVAEDARRAAYDKQEHSIDGSAIQLDTQHFTVIPAGEFKSMPDFRGGDTLESPRKISLGSDGCTDIDVPNLKGMSLHLGIAEYNPLGAYSVVAYAKDSNTLNVCVVGDFSSSDLTSDQMDIGVQLTR